MAVSGGGYGRGDVAVGVDSEVGGCGAAGGGRVGLGELVVRGGEADLESFCLAGPAFAFGLGYAGEQVVADVFQLPALAGGNPQEWTPDTAVLMDAAGAVCPAAVAERDPPAFEVAEELVPLLVGRGPVFFAGPEFAPTGDERPVAADALLGIDRFVTHCGVYIVVSEY
jgi:hypothetical protein